MLQGGQNQLQIPEKPTLAKQIAYVPTSQTNVTEIEQHEAEPTQLPLQEEEIFPSEQEQEELSMQQREEEISMVAQEEEIPILHEEIPTPEEEIPVPEQEILMPPQEEIPILHEEIPTTEEEIPIPEHEILMPPHEETHMPQQEQMPEPEQILHAQGEQATPASYSTIVSQTPQAIPALTPSLAPTPQATPAPTPQAIPAPTPQITQAPAPQATPSLKPYTFPTIINPDNFKKRYHYYLEKHTESQRNLYREIAPKISGNDLNECRREIEHAFFAHMKTVIDNIKATSVARRGDCSNIIAARSLDASVTNNDDDAKTAPTSFVGEFCDNFPLESQKRVEYLEQKKQKKATVIHRVVRDLPDPSELMQNDLINENHLLQDLKTDPTLYLPQYRTNRQGSKALIKTEMFEELVERNSESLEDFILPAQAQQAQEKDSKNIAVQDVGHFLLNNKFYKNSKVYREYLTINDGI